MNKLSVLFMCIIRLKAEGSFYLFLYLPVSCFLTHRERSKQKYMANTHANNFGIRVYLV